MLSIGGKHYQSSEKDGVFTQNGSAAVEKGQTVDIYYPVPYASPPNLMLDDRRHSYTIIDQNPDHFRVRRDGDLGGCLDWTARGVRRPVATTSEVATASGTQP